MSVCGFVQRNCFALKTQVLLICGFFQFAVVSIVAWFCYRWLQTSCCRETGRNHLLTIICFLMKVNLFRSGPVIYFCEKNSVLGITIRKTNDNTMGVFEMCAIARSAGKRPPIHRSRNISGDGVLESATPIDHTANNHSIRRPSPPSVGVFHSFVCMT